MRPFVRDTRNLFFVRPVALPGGTGAEVVRQRGIQAVFQVEQREIAVDRVGSRTRRSLLFWEAAEGGTWI